MSEEEIKDIIDNMSEKELNDFIFFALQEMTKKYEYLVKRIRCKVEEINKAYEDSKDEYGETEYYYPNYTVQVLEELLENEEREVQK